MLATEAILARLIAESAIRDTTTRFAEAASFSDFNAFRALWTPDGVWTIGEPFKARVEGPDAITELLRKLRQPKEFFIQTVFQGSIMIEGDLARSRCIVHESGRGPDDQGFRCHSVTDDLLRRSNDGWAFVQRNFEYVWLDRSYFAGETFKTS